MSDFFSQALVKKPKRSRTDFSHSNTVGMKFGFLYPTEVRYIAPGDDVSISMSQVARLAPMPVPTFADMKVRHDFFFVPCRLMYNERDMSAIFGSAGDADAKERSCCSLSNFIMAFSGSDEYLDEDEDTPADSLAKIRRSGDFYMPGSLFDFLGYPVPDDVNTANPDNTIPASMLQLESNYLDLAEEPKTYSGYLNTFYGALIGTTFTSAKVLLEPLMAYHFIWRDWYRFTGVNDGSDIVEPYLENHCLSAFGNALFGDDIVFDTFVNEILASSYFNSADFGTDTTTFGQLLGRLRECHMAKDMFTSVRYGSKPTVLIPTGANANIPTLREASAIQRFIDLVSIAGSRYYDKVKALFNVKATGFADDRVQFLARYQQYIKIGEVLTTATTESAKTGDYAGRGILIDGKYIFKRHFDEPGWLFCISSIVPDVVYTGLSRQLTDTYFVDTPIPALAHVGDQTVFNREVNFQFNSTNYNDNSFGDQFRYYAYKSAPNELHGSFHMASMRPWVATTDITGDFDVIGFSKVSAYRYNKFFNDTTCTPIFGDRFFFKLDFSEFITRQLPKYINYHL